MPSKQRIRVVAAATPVYGLFGGTRASVVVDDTRPGSVTVVDRAKRYYKAAIAAVGTLSLALTQVTPLFDGVLAGTVAREWFVLAVSVVTTAGVILKENEHWVDGR